MTKAFVGYEFIKIRGKLISNPEVNMFVDSTSNETYKTLFFGIDDYEDQVRLKEDLLYFIKLNKVELLLFNLRNEEVSDQTLLELKNVVKTLNWFGDDQWRFNNFSKKKAKYFTYCVTTDHKSLLKYKNIGIENIFYSQWGSLNRFEGEDKFNYKYEISFIGSYSIYREWVIRKIFEKGFEVSVFGMGWDNEKFVNQNEFEKIVLITSAKKTL